MKYRVESFALGDRDCWVCLPGEGPLEGGYPLIVMATDGEMMTTPPPILAALEEISDEKAPVLAGFASDDWDREFTPWPAPALGKKNEPFSGEGAKTLAWLLGDFLPHLEAVYPVSGKRAARSILGYSLGGLFALWSFLESGAFGGCASCSGSLWYDGWMEYAAGKEIQPNSRIYLSLGRAEKKARNPRMAKVGDVTRAYAETLEKNPNVEESALAWHEGGHFQDVTQRIQEAVLWLAK